jgi:outer membrane receptor protein involved in Fe transport
MTTIRTRLLATSMITGLALVAVPAGVAFAADATADTSPMATMNTSATGPAAAPVQTLQLRAAADATDTTASTGEIVVTGSRIPQPNLTSVSPIEAVGHQEFQLQGKTDVIDILNNLPQNFQNNTADFSNTSNPLSSPGGVSTADLRGLGPQRTLVLVNGRRLGIGDANTGNNNPAPDLDQIPVAMIDHVEVVTGGASATYGSDAIAGVVNFILKDNFEGVQIDGTFGADQHSQHMGAADSAIRAGIAVGSGGCVGAGCLGPLKLPGDAFDGQNEDASILFGVNSPDSKGNITAYFEFRHQSPVLYKNRDFSACQVVLAGGKPICTGSANSNLFEPLNPAAGVPTGTVVGNQLLPFPQPGSSPPAYFNSNNYEYLSRGDTRYLAGFEAHYDFSEHATLYSEFSFMNDQSLTQIAPSGAFAGGNPFDPTGSGGFLINCNNPLMSGEERGAIGCSPADIASGASQDVFIGRRNIEGGPRIATYDHFNFRGVLGIRGDISDAWHYDVYGSYYNTFLNQGNLNYLSYSKIGKALQVVNVGGVPTCTSVVNGSDSACVPYNIFQTGGVTAAQLNYLDIVGFESGTVQEDVVEGDLNGDLGKYGIRSPWAQEGIQVAVGFDWRRDQLDFTPDAVVGSGDLAGGSGVGATIHQGIDVWEGYGETRIPIVQNAPFAHLFEIEGGVRYSGYSTGPAPITFKAGLEWEPVEDFRLRASFNRAIRAPSVIELFNPTTITQSNQFGSNGDPCSGASPAFTLAQCERTGVTAAQYGHITQCFADQCDTSTGGNPNLAPEQADTYSVGATFQPRWVRGLTASIDWWDIKETGFVGTIPPNIVVTECATTGAPQFCGLIHRSPSTGFLFGPSDLTQGGFVVGNGQNIAAGEAEGIDFQGNYRLDLDDVGAHGFGSLDMAFNGALQMAGTTILPGVSPYDCTGLFGSKCQTVNPTWRHTFRMTWNTPWNVLASLQWRYIGDVSLDTNTSNPTLTNGKHDAFDATLPAINYLDLSGAWRVNTVLTLRAGINNILDQDPPLVNNKITGTGTPNTYPTYDLLGRQMFVSATAKF